MREFKSVAEMLEHYREVHERLWGSPPPAPTPAPEPPPPPLVPSPAAIEPEAEVKALMAADQPLPRSMKLIVRLVAEFYSAELPAIYGPFRGQPTTEVRHIAMHFVNEFCAKGTPTIGRLFRRDHSSVVHALWAIANRAANDPDFATKLDECRQYIKDRW